MFQSDVEPPRSVRTLRIPEQRTVTVQSSVDFVRGVSLVWNEIYRQSYASLFHPHGPRIPADRVIETIQPFERKKSPKLAIFHLVNLGMIYCLN